MNTEITQLFDEYLSKTGDPNAAATLVLAQVNAANASPSTHSGTLSPPQIARQLHVSPSKVLQWIKSGQLKAANVAKGKRPRYVIQRADLELFLQSRQPQVSPSSRRNRRNKRVGTRSTQQQRY